MGWIDVVRNGFNAALGKNQEFTELLAKNDVSRAKAMMNDRTSDVNKAIAEYDVETHDIMKREPKRINDGKGNFMRWQEQWKLPIPYPAYINEIALVMLFGRPIKWKQKSKGTDKAFQAYTDLIKDTRFDSRIRQLKRLAGKETECALLYHHFRGNDGKPKMLLKVLAKSLGDEIRTMFDQYDRMTSFGRGYYLRESGKTVYHFDIFTDEVIYRCKKASIGWQIKEEDNLLGKIPVVYIKQDKEHKGVEPLIKREEYVISTDADVNDYFASPAVVADADIIENLPEKEEVGKFYIKTPGSDSNGGKPLYYLTWDAASEAKENEIKRLQYHIHSKSFTPKIDLESIHGLSDISGKALEQLFLPASIKAAKNKEIYSELIDRMGSLFIASIANILDISLKSECDKLIVSHEFQKPFAEDISEALKRLIDTYEAEGMSQETFVELNPLIEDSVLEMERLKKEAEARTDKQKNAFYLEGAEV